MPDTKKHVEDDRWPLESPIDNSNGTEEDADLLAEAADIMNNPDSVLEGIDFGAKAEADYAVAA